jgi:hypothetical protein
VPAGSVVAGEVFHVDSFARNGKVALAVPPAYGGRRCRSPMRAASSSRRLPDKSPEAVALLAANRKPLIGFELHIGVAHRVHRKLASPSRDLHAGGAYIVNVVKPRPA